MNDGSDYSVYSGMENYSSHESNYVLFKPSHQIFKLTPPSLIIALSLNDLCNTDFKSLWPWIPSPRLPCGTPCLVVGTVYHPHAANEE